MKRTASAVWTGNLKEGHGSLSTESGLLGNTPYSFNDRFESGPGTNPEELIGAAHAGCFSMALAAQLGEAGLTPERITTFATVTLEKLDDGFSITQIHLTVTARIPGIEQRSFEAIAEKAKRGCPVSKLLTATITMEAKLDAVAPAAPAAAGAASGLPKIAAG